MSNWLAITSRQHMFPFQNKAYFEQYLFSTCQSVHCDRHFS